MIRFALGVLLMGLVFLAPDAAEINRAGRALVWAALVCLVVAWLVGLRW